MSDKRYPGGFEEFVLLAVQRLDPEAYGAAIRVAVSAAVGGEVAVGAIYITLVRLERKGLLLSRQGEPTHERGGRAKRYYNLTATGLEMINEARRIRDALQGR